jgi:hypothetical protein
MKLRKASFVSLGAILVLALIIGVTVVFAQADDGDTAPDTETTPPAASWGWRGHHGFPGGFGPKTGSGELLAAELGITVEELQAAFQEVRAAMVDQGWPGFPGHRGLVDSDDYLNLLADALDGIDVETLREAMEAVESARLAQLLDEGVLTQEQLDLKAAMEALGRTSIRGRCWPRPWDCRSRICRPPAKPDSRMRPCWKSKA